MTQRRVQLAVLSAFLLHGLLILGANYRLSYDAYVHMFFSDHYARDWWSLWDARWYTGFFVSSYPPLVHQLIALFSRLVGLDTAFALTLWITVTLYPLAVYAFSRIFTGRTISSYAALGAAFIPSVYLAAHIFGQLPFLFSTLFALFSAASLARYLKEGGALNLALTLSLFMTTMASHHATLLVHPFLILAVIARIFSLRKDTESHGKNNLRIAVVPRLLRLAIFIPLALALAVIVIWPFWEWGRGQTIQTPIDHPSRHNFITDPLAAVMFFIPMYGLFVLIIHFIFTHNRRLIGLALSFVILFIIGLGSTTPLPRLLFGRGWEWLTYDRFAYWASLTLLPFFGIAVARLRHKINLIYAFGALAITSLVIGFITHILPLQPGRVDMTQVVDFLNEGDHSDYRYLTFGFGDQLALLSTLTTATTTDGSYHTARTLPELRSSGIGQIDTAFWNVKGLESLDPILQKSGERGVRWGFVNVQQYIPVLERNGWIIIKTLRGGVQVWENPKAVLPEQIQQPPANPLAEFSWGTFPLLSLLTTISLAAFRLRSIRAEKVLRSARAFLVALIPLTLCTWYYRILADVSHPRVYFTYDQPLFFLNDALAMTAIVLWLCAKIASPNMHGAPPSTYDLRTRIFSIAIPLLSSLSILWSRDWRTSLYISLHLWLVFLFILFLRESPEAWKPLMYGFCAALSVQLITGFAGFALQSTVFLDSLNLTWPGNLDPSMRGASVVQLADGPRILRAYGTLPHPNILGGFALATLLGPASLFLENKKPNYPALVLFSLGIILICLTFSRSAWLGLTAFTGIMIAKSKYLGRRKLCLFLAVNVLTILLALYPLRALAFTRISNAPVATEQLSTFGRSWLAKQAVEMIREHPFTGVGAGSFTLKLSEYAMEGAPIEPVHNMLLLATAELGVPGLIAITGVVISLGRIIIKTQTPRSILASAALIGLGVISLFDHYLWTVAPGRIMLGLTLGLWMGQVANDA
jgi:O-antigen ligase